MREWGRLVVGGLLSEEVAVGWSPFLVYCITIENHLGHEVARSQLRRQEQLTTDQTAGPWLQFHSPHVVCGQLLILEQAQC